MGGVFQISIDPGDESATVLNLTPHLFPSCIVAEYDNILFAVFTVSSIQFSSIEYIPMFIAAPMSYLGNWFSLTKPKLSICSRQLAILIRLSLM